MTIVVRASATAVGSLTNPRTVNKPTGTAQGDLLILQVLNTQDATITPPSGFTLIPGAEMTGAPSHRLYWKVAGASEPASYDVGFSTGICALGIVALYSDTGNVIALDQLATNVDSVSDTNYVAAGVTVGNAPALLAIWFGLPSASSLTPPAGMTEVYDASTTPRMQFSTQAIASTGATGDKTATGGSSTTSKNITVSLYEASPAPNAPTSLTATAVDHQQIDLTWNDNNNPGDFDAIEVERSPDGVSNWTVLSTSVLPGAQAYSDTGLDPETTYYYRVRARVD